MTAVHTRYISRNWPRGCASPASPRAPPPGQDTPHQECPPPTLWPCCSPGTCITTRPPQGPQRSPDRQADSDHGSVLDRLREDASARHDFFPLMGRITSSAIKRNDMPKWPSTGRGESAGALRICCTDPTHAAQAAGQRSTVSSGCMSNSAWRIRTAARNRRASCPRDHGLRGTRPGPAST
jgi:hypothetical protein